MLLSDYHFDLPDECIARFPAKVRSQSKLLVLNRNLRTYQDHLFSEVTDFLRPHDLIVANNSKVMAARLFAQKTTKGKVEILVERVFSPHRFLAMVRSSKALKPGQILTVFTTEHELSAFQFKVLTHEGEGFWTFESEHTIFDVMASCGSIPLPPYMARASDATDLNRYQTVYAKHLGSCAAPTAGLHFDEAVLASLQEKQIDWAEITLHVGAGTFMPIRVQDITQHQMHHEWIEVSEATVEKINRAKQNGGRVIAAGTTATRALETAALQGKLAPFTGETNIFIRPGFQFRVIDGLITNFHLPESTLLILVSTFASRDFILESYQHAIKSGYRFYSYGDAMLIL